MKNSFIPYGNKNFFREQWTLKQKSETSTSHWFKHLRSLLMMVCFVSVTYVAFMFVLTLSTPRAVADKHRSMLQTKPGTQNMSIQAPAGFDIIPFIVVPLVILLFC